jgi:hypothetical protein
MGLVADVGYDPTTSTLSRWHSTTELIRYMLYIPINTYNKCQLLPAQGW